MARITDLVGSLSSAKGEGKQMAQFIHASLFSEAQESQYIAFVANFTHQLAEAGIPRAQAKITVALAASTLLPTMFRVKPNVDKTLDEFAAVVVRQAIKQFYREGK